MVQAVISYPLDLYYGCVKVSLMSGKLHGLLATYFKRTPELTGNGHVSGFLERVRRKDRMLVADSQFHALLKALAADPVMQQVQDEMYEVEFFRVAQLRSRDKGIQSCLGRTIILDSCVQGNYQVTMRSVRIPEPYRGGSETEWLQAYCEKRQAWLKRQPERKLAESSWRPGFFLNLLKQGNYSMELPLQVGEYMLEKGVGDETQASIGTEKGS